METIFVDRRGTDLSINHGRLKIVNPKHTIDTSLPLQQMRALVISCECSLSASMLRSLAKYDVALLCLHPNDVEASFINVPNTHGNIQRKLSHYALSQNTQYATRLAKLVVRMKVRQQKMLLLSRLEQRPEKRTELMRALAQFPNTTNHSLSSHEIPQLMGVEGAAARAYFGGYRSLFAKSLGFQTRNKRPPKDPVNACLSLTYTLLYFEALRSCYSLGLEPMLGFLHQSTFNRASLACDLMELGRARADEWVVSLFNSQTLVPSHFKTTEDKGCMLGKIGRKIFFENLMLQLPACRKRLRRNACWLARFIDAYERGEKV
ncbi:CRISPR-associated endonuclease Cas1 [Vibrio breoganii]